MRTLDEQSSRSYSLGARLARNARLLIKIGSMVKSYFTTGAAIRRKYRDKERRGDIYYVDES